MFIDLSSNNGTVKFSEITGVDEVFIRASLGYGDADKLLSSNANGAANAGLPVSYYHFSYPHSNTPDVVGDAAKQANYFVQLISPLPKYKQLAVDLENLTATTDTTLSQTDYAIWLQSFLDTVEQLTGVKCIIYSYADYLNRHLPDNHNFGVYDLWLANYGETQNPPLPKGWPRYWARQYSESGAVAGIGGKVDLSQTA